MTKSKKVFLLLAFIFFGLLIYVSYDISSRTTFPGSKPQLKERLQEQFLAPDTVKGDSLSSVKR
jgi:hypothetical protein